MNLTLKSTLTTALLLAVAGCAPEVGSKKWCETMQEKPKGEWSMNEAGDFAKHCIFSTQDE